MLVWTAGNLYEFKEGGWRQITHVIYFMQKKHGQSRRMQSQKWTTKDSTRAKWNGRMKCERCDKANRRRLLNEYMKGRRRPKHTHLNDFEAD